MKLKGISDAGMKRLARSLTAQADEGAERSDIGRFLSRGFDAGNYDAAYEGGDWAANLERLLDEGEDDADDETFVAGYILGFIPGSTDSWMWDEDYLEAWGAYGKDAEALGIAVDDPYEAQQEDEF